MQLTAPFYIHEDCEKLLKQVPAQAKMFGLGEVPMPAEPDRLLTTESETIELDSIKLKTLIHTGSCRGTS